MQLWNIVLLSLTASVACAPLQTYTADTRNSRSSGLGQSNDGTVDLPTNADLPTNVDPKTLATVESIEIVMDSETGVIVAGLDSKISAFGITSDNRRIDISANVTWSSDDEEIAIADSSAMKLNARKAGKTKIAATLDKISMEKTIEVSEATVVDYRFPSDDYPENFKHCKKTCPLLLLT
jgi:hypothetical protein